MLDNPALLAGFILKSENKFWREQFEKSVPSSLIQKNGPYWIQISNSNWDVKQKKCGTTEGVYDGIVLESKNGVLCDYSPLTTGLGVWWDCESQTLTLISSPASSRKIFYRILPTGVVFSSDTRLLIRPEDNLDPVGAGQLVVYGATGGSRSIISGVKMLSFGTAVKFNLGKEQISEEIFPAIKYETKKVNISEQNIDNAIDKVRERLQTTLKHISSHKIALMLSGGIDSGLMACMLRDIGIKNLQMFTCGFNEDDLDVEYAVRLSKKLGYSHTVIMLKEDEALKMLDECARAYSMPFGDFSTASSYFFIKRITTLVDKGTYLLDGTAGDALFGFGGLRRIARNHRLWKIPYSVKQLASQYYSNLSLWQNQGFFSRAVGAIATAITPHPMLIGAVLTPWAGRLSIGTKQVLTGGGELLNSAKSILQGQEFSDEDLLTSLDFVHVCGSLYSNKVADPARHFGCAVEFPFMWPEMTQLGLSLPVWLKFYHNQAKHPLKQLLTSCIGTDYTNRPKTGFTPPLKKWLTQPNFNKWFQQVISNGQFLRDVVQKMPVVRIVRAALGNPHHFQNSAYSLVWTVVFAEKWFASIKDWYK